ncbi:hypothetical protein LIER_19068 [Lithospermum erythrorhizon]|uniref:Uncharacterized protein n=1 Tax=Lithospermum erythrorhizon TaxID=34254 RepID=A0AAV3QGB2_LITER
MRHVRTALVLLMAVSYFMASVTPTAPVRDPHDPKAKTQGISNNNNQEVIQVQDFRGDNGMQYFGGGKEKKGGVIGSRKYLSHMHIGYEKKESSSLSSEYGMPSSVSGSVNNHHYIPRENFNNGGGGGDNTDSGKN